MSYYLVAFLPRSLSHSWGGRSFPIAFAAESACVFKWWYVTYGTHNWKVYQFQLEPNLHNMAKIGNGFFSAVVVVAVVMAKYRRLSIEIDSHANYNENGSERKEEKSSFFQYKRKIWPTKKVQHIRIWAIIICQRHIKWIVLFYSVSFFFIIRLYCHKRTNHNNPYDCGGCAQSIRVKMMEMMMM